MYFPSFTEEKLKVKINIFKLASYFTKYLTVSCE